MSKATYIFTIIFIALYLTGSTIYELKWGILCVLGLVAYDVWKLNKGGKIVAMKKDEKIGALIMRLTGLAIGIGVTQLTQSGPWQISAFVGAVGVFLALRKYLKNE
jgi:hypothetical protein